MPVVLFCSSNRASRETSRVSKSYVEAKIEGIPIARSPGQTNLKANSQILCRLRKDLIDNKPITFGSIRKSCTSVQDGGIEIPVPWCNSVARDTGIDFVDVNE